MLLLALGVAGCGTETRTPAGAAAGLLSRWRSFQPMLEARIGLDSVRRAGTNFRAALELRYRQVAAAQPAGEVPPPPPPEAEAKLLAEGQATLDGILAWMAAHPVEARAAARLRDEDMEACLAVYMVIRHAQLGGAVGRGRISFDAEGHAAARELLARTTEDPAADAANFALALRLVLRSFYVSEPTYQAQPAAYERLTDSLVAHLKAHPDTVSPETTKLIGSLARDFGDIGAAARSERLMGALDGARGAEAPLEDLDRDTRKAIEQLEASIMQRAQMMSGQSRGLDPEKARALELRFLEESIQTLGRAMARAEQTQVALPAASRDWYRRYLAFTQARVKLQEEAVEALRRGDEAAARGKIAESSRLRF